MRRLRDERMIVLKDYEMKGWKDTKMRGSRGELGVECCN